MDNGTRALGDVLRALLFAAAAALVSIPAAAKGTGYVFVSNQRGNTVSVLDGRTFSVIKTLPVGDRPQDMAFSADRRQIFVVAGRSDRLDVIDVAGLTVTGTLPAGEYPEMLAVHPNGKAAYVTNEESATVSVVDLATRTIARKVNVAAEPEGALLTADGAKAFVACEGAGTVAIIDTATGTRTGEIKVGPKPRRLAATPNGAEVWLSTEAAGAVQVLSTATGAVVASIAFEPPGVRREDIRPVGLAIAHDGRRAYVALSRAEVVAVVDVPSRQVRSYWPAGKRPWNVALGAQDRLLFVANAQSDDVTPIDTETGKALQPIRVGKTPHTILVDE